MADLIAQVLKIVIWIASGIIKKVNLTKAQKKAFYEFVEKMDKVYIPANLKTESEVKVGIRPVKYGYWAEPEIGAFNDIGLDNHCDSYSLSITAVEVVRP